MNSHSSQMLLSADDPPPVNILNPHGASPFLLIGDHAGNAVPSALGSLGLGEEEMTRHIAWDPGTGNLGARLSAELDAVFIHQTYSRLVIDCNRDPERADAIPAMSDMVRVPGNDDLAPSDRAARVREIHSPYQDAIAAELARRDAAEKEAILVSLHSFTPAMQGIARPWEIGVLYSEGNTSFARSVLRLLRASGDLVVGDNQPYVMDSTDYTVPRHAFPLHRRYIEIEIRQDLLAEPEHHAAWSTRLAVQLRLAAAGAQWEDQP
jgi:predicted N-formylglutamate amidohydrolase